MQREEKNDEIVQHSKIPTDFSPSPEKVQSHWALERKAYVYGGVPQGAVGPLQVSCVF